MSKGISSKTCRIMIYLISAVLNDSEIKNEYICDVDLNALYKLAKSQSLDSLVCFALEKTDIFSSTSDNANAEILKAMQESKNKAIRKTLLLDAERNKLLAFMEQNGILHMPLKGCILKEFYPKLGMRQMADNDIFYDIKFRSELKKYMIASGYKAVSVGKSNHDIYEKPPIYNFELHTDLFNRTNDDRFIEYYKDLSERFVRDDDNRFGCHFSDEDFYIYITAHSYKHFSAGGTGLRYLVDIYLWLRKKEKSLDWHYVEGELKKLGISEFESKCRLLSEKLFSDADKIDEISLTDDEKNMLELFTSFGTYGNIKQYKENSVKKFLPKKEKITTKDKISYVFHRIFPSIEWFEKYDPFFAKHKYLIPISPLIRIIRGVLFRRKKMKYELNALKNIQDNK